MKVFFTITLIACTVLQLHAQTSQPSVPAISQKEMKEMKPKIGIKAGYNFSKITGSTPNFSPKSNNGFMVAGFFAPQSKGIGYRTELAFSRQGFSFDQSGKMQDVSQDYIYMPHLTTFTIAKKFNYRPGDKLVIYSMQRNHHQAKDLLKK